VDPGTVTIPAPLLAWRPLSGRRALSGGRLVDPEAGLRPAPIWPGHHDVVHPRRELPAEELVPLVDRVVEGALHVHDRPDR